MTKVKFPLFSQTASGNLKKEIIYTTVKGVHIAKKYNKATDTYTTLQQVERAIFLQGANAWKDLTPEEQEAFNEQARGYALTGYNIYMAEFIDEERKKLKYARYGVGKYGVNLYAP